VNEQYLYSVGVTAVKEDSGAASGHARIVRTSARPHTAP